MKKCLLFTMFSFSLGCSLLMAQMAYRVSDREVSNLLKRIDEDAHRFRNSIKDALDKSRFDDKRIEKDINRFIKDFEISTDRLEKRFSRKDSADTDVQDVLHKAGRIDRLLANISPRSVAHENWGTLRANLEELARAYEVSWGGEGTVQSTRRVNDDEVRTLLKGIESAADRFRTSLKRALENSTFDGRRAEDNVSQFVKDFESATDRLEQRFNNKTSAASDVEEVLTRASRIDSFMVRQSLDSSAEDDWVFLRKALDELARAYGVVPRWDRPRL